MSMEGRGVEQTERGAVEEKLTSVVLPGSRAGQCDRAVEGENGGFGAETR